MHDPYLQLLSEAKEKLLKGEGCTSQDFSVRLNQMNIDTKVFGERLYEKIYDVRPTSGSRAECLMRLDAYMMLLEYEELQQAREDSTQARQEAKEATNWAKRALIVSIGAIVLQIVLALTGIC